MWSGKSEKYSLWKRINKDVFGCRIANRWKLKQFKALISYNKKEEVF